MNSDTELLSPFFCYFLGTGAGLFLAYHSHSGWPVVLWCVGLVISYVVFYFAAKISKPK